MAYEIVELDLKKLNQIDLKKFESLTETEFYCCFSSIDPLGTPQTDVVALCAYDNEEPIGLILASHYLIMKQAEIHSIFIKESYQNKGIGTQLMGALESHLLQKKCPLIYFKYPQNSSTANLEKILEKSYWLKPKTFLVRCYLDAFAFNPPWFQKKYCFPSNVEVIAPQKMSAENLEHIKELIEQRGIPLLVSPFNEFGEIEPINSLYLKWGSEIIGWMINHRIDQGTIRYSAYYIIKEYRLKSLAINLLRESINLQKKSPVQWAIFESNLDCSSCTWIAFVKKKLIPYAKKTIEFSQTWKSLKI